MCKCGYWRGIRPEPGRRPGGRNAICFRDVRQNSSQVEPYIPALLAHTRTRTHTRTHAHKFKNTPKHTHPCTHTYMHAHTHTLLRLNTSAAANAYTPDESSSTSPFHSPPIVYVLPLPVCPYAKHVAMPCSKIQRTRGCAVYLYTVLQKGKRGTGRDEQGLHTVQNT